jgi:glucose-6-phosphate dehydrogenase assembly protein OpcA
MEALEPARVRDVASVERQLAEMWRAASSEESPVVRASMLNLVVACDTPEEAREATEAVALLSLNHPGRALVVSGAREGSRPGEPLAVFVSAHGHRGPGGSLLCSEQVTLEAARSALPQVPSALLRLLVENMPVFVWWRRAALAGDSLWEPLARMANRFLVDSSRHANPAAALRDLETLADLPSWRGNTGDLAWTRLEGWREAIASIFDSPLTRGHLNRIARVEVACGGPAGPGGATVAGAYLAGWMASRLGWSRGAAAWSWRRRDGGAVSAALSLDPALTRGDVGSVRIDAPGGDPPARFLAERIAPGAPVVRLTVEVEKTCPLPASLRIAAPNVSALLCRALERTSRDPVFEAALREAARLAAA